MIQNFGIKNSSDHTLICKKNRNFNEISLKLLTLRRFGALALASREKCGHRGRARVWVVHWPDFITRGGVNWTACRWLGYFSSE